MLHLRYMFPCEKVSKPVAYSKSQQTEAAGSDHVLRQGSTRFNLAAERQKNPVTVPSIWSHKVVGIRFTIVKKFGVYHVLYRGKSKSTLQTFTPV